MTLLLLRDHLHRGNVVALPLAIRQAQRKAQAPGANPRLAVLLLCEAAAGAHMMGQLEGAEQMLAQADALLPAGSQDVLSRIRAMTVCLLLDHGDLAEARAAAERVDATEVLRDGGVHLWRREGNVTAAGWAIAAETALAERHLEEAYSCLAKGIRRLDSGAEGIKMQPARGKPAALMREWFRFLDGLWLIQSGSPKEGHAKLQQLEARLRGDEAVPASFFACLGAASGKWREGEALLPGINIYEARRWTVLGQGTAAAAATLRPSPLEVAGVAADVPPEMVDRLVDQVVARLERTAGRISRAATLPPAELAPVAERDSFADWAEHLQLIVGALDRRALLQGVCSAAAWAGGNVAAARLLAAGQVYGEAHTDLWTAAAAQAAAYQRLAVIGEGVELELATVTPLPDALTSALLGVAALRLEALKAPELAPREISAVDGIVLASARIRAVFQRAEELAAADGLAGRPLVHVLITGETGVGKELVARQIHNSSGRVAGPWRAQNLSAMPKDLLRAALFGHVRGAFTGAEQDRPGLLREAEEGTLLLDEFGEFGLSEQAVLLRVLEAGEYFRVGEETARTLKTRLVLTTNRSIDDERVFRPDLKYRCKLIRVPALSERAQEIGPLASYFAAGKGAGMTEAGVAWCEGQAWPGNVRQLKSVVEEAASVCAGGDVALKALASAAHNYTGTRTSAPQAADESLSVRPGETMAQALKRIERTFAAEALAQAGTARGRKSRAAAIYGANRHTFYDLLERYNLS